MTPADIFTSKPNNTHRPTAFKHNPTPKKRTAALWATLYLVSVNDYDKDELKRLYNHDLVITLYELPDLKAASRRQ